MIYVFGTKAEVTTERQCTRSDQDHVLLRNEARVDRQKNNFNVDDSFVICMRCVKAVSLRV